MDTITEKIISMEKAALGKWGNGDPSGFLDISAPDVVYFDPYIPERIDGLNALREYYLPIWGKIIFDRFELVNPTVQVRGDMAVLTFNYISYKGKESDRWNCTEVYQRAQNEWKIIQSHWSYTEVFKNKIFEHNA
jgi:ketosteroid isomerase-like protein